MRLRGLWTGVDGDAVWFAAATRCGAAFVVWFSVALAVACDAAGPASGRGAAELRDAQASPVRGGTVPVGVSPGYSFERAFAAMDDSRRSAVIAKMVADGVAWERLDYYPDSDFDRAFIVAARRAGIEVDVLLEDFGATPAAFAAFAAGAVATLRPAGADTYEILNEVNLYRPEIRAGQYVPVLQAAYTAIKRGDAAATVLMSGLGPGSGRRQPAAYLRAMYEAGAKGYFDAANLHPYSYPAMPLPPARSGCQDWNTFCHGAPAMRAVMDAHGDASKSIWFTEFGCPTGTAAGYRRACSEERLAQQIAQAYAQSRSWGWVGALFIFSWQDDAGDGDFGLYTATGSPKPYVVPEFLRITSSGHV